MYWLFCNVPQQPENLQINIQLMWLNSCAQSGSSCESSNTWSPYLLCLIPPTSCAKGVRHNLSSSGSSCRACLREVSWAVANVQAVPSISLCRKVPPQVRVKREDSDIARRFISTQSPSSNKSVSTTTQELFWYRELRVAAELFSTPRPSG